MAYKGQGSVWAWVNFNSAGNTSIRNSSNCSSITDNGTCDMTLNFSTNAGTDGYGWFGSIGHDSENQQGWISSPSGTGYSTWKATSGLRVRSVYGNQASNIDPQDQTIFVLYNT